MLIKRLFATYGTFTVIVRASLFYGTCRRMYLWNETERKLTNYWRKRQHLLHSTRYLKQIDRFDARNYMSY